MSAMLRFGGLLGVSAIGAGTYGAHGLEGHLQELQLEEEEKLRWMKNWSSATGIHQFGATTVMALAAAQKAGLLARPALIGGLIGTGTAVFAGSLYLGAYYATRDYSKVAPAGGSALLLGLTVLVFFP
uniref:DUF423 domain-containing protein n=1 Tax=Pinguiococcus pyrenoidosus TaxID=172671 RepID=A0A7R9U1Q6_9STRA|mmetsp:Transcript_11613/g.43317  ORF Transcript_11613/g.43317 Transcript_11613/m.43317 type:complete len:128 (+) Transcript_11613:65-448(+)